MNTQKILELLGTTPDKKMQTLKREMSFPATAEESANDLLNAELYGTKKAAVEAVKKSTVRKPLKKAMESASKEGVYQGGGDGHQWAVRIEDEDEDRAFFDDDDAAYRYARQLANDDEIRNKFNCDILVCETRDDWATWSICSRIEIQPPATKSNSSGGTEPIIPAGEADKPGKHFDACPKEARDFLVKLLNVINSGDCKKAKHMLVEFMGMVPVSSTEMVVEAQTENFPSTFDFDEEKFAEDYVIDKDSITCIHIAEDPEAKIEEHIEVSFKATEDDKESTVVLSIAPDMLVSETIDAEVIEPAQFSAAFVEEENEEGEMRTRLVLTLVDGEEETDVVMSEGDVDHVDENGDATTDEFVEEAGLNLDPFYSKQHGMKIADKGAHESLAAKIIRSSK